MSPAQRDAPAVRVGIGGWTYAPWRDSFYPAGLPHDQELAHASRRFGALEINASFYGQPAPASVARWREATPADFVFSVKAPRAISYRRALAETGDAVQRFVALMQAGLSHKLGPIVWQLPPTRRFDPADLDAFLGALPAQAGGQRVRHALDVRHDSFRTPAYLALARRHRVATVFTDADDRPSFADVTGDFVYLRLMRTDPALPAGCTPQALAQVAACAAAWRDGREPDGVPRIEPPPAPVAPRDVFVYFIAGAKERAPAAALAVQAALDRG